MGGIAGAIATVAAVVAAGLFMYAATIKVPDNTDTIVAELQRISRWNSYGCIAAAIGAAVAFAQQSKLL